MCPDREEKLSRTLGLQRMIRSTVRSKIRSTVTIAIRKILWGHRITASAFVYFTMATMAILRGNNLYNNVLVCHSDLPDFTPPY